MVTPGDGLVVGVDKGVGVVGSVGVCEFGEVGIALEVGVVDACAAGHLVAVRVDGRVRGEPNAFHSFRFSLGPPNCSFW